ncbi:MAG: rhodanese-like domain-containing protein [Anaerolineae bacterium]|nr:rhodanese-like domain-containing protein [Anaerolineae bacterium]
MKDSKTHPRWIGWLAPILLLAVVAGAAWLLGAAVPAAEPAGAIASPSAVVQYRMAQVKTATPLPTATTRVAATRTAAPTPTLVPTLPAPPTSSVVASLNQVARIAVDAARTQVEMGTAVFVDVRTEATYQQGHLPGAISLPGGVSTSGYKELPDDRLLIFY